MYYRYPLLILLLMTLLTGVVRAQSDTTPLPTPTLNPILPTPDATSLQVGEWLEGEITNQEASYLISLDGGQLYRVDVDGPYMVEIASYSPEGSRRLKFSGGGPSAWTVIPWFEPDFSGIYQVKVYSGVSGSRFRLRLMEITPQRLTQDTPLTGNLTVPGDVSVIRVSGDSSRLMTFRATGDVPVSLAIERQSILAQAGIPIQPDGYRAYSTELSVELDRVILGADSEWLLLVYASNRDQTGSFEVSMTAEPLPGLYDRGTNITLSPEQPVLRMWVYGQSAVYLVDTGGTAGLEFQFYDYSTYINSLSPYPVPTLRVVSATGLSERFRMSPGMYLVEVRATNPTATIETDVKLLQAEPLPLTETPQSLTLSQDYPTETFSFTYDLNQPMRVKVEADGDNLLNGVQAEISMNILEMYYAQSSQGGDLLKSLVLTMPQISPEYGNRFPAWLTVKLMQPERTADARLRVWLEPLGR